MVQHLFRCVSILAALTKSLVLSVLLVVLLAVPSFGSSIKFHECTAIEKRSDAVLVLDATDDFAAGNASARLLVSSDAADADTLSALDAILKQCPGVEVGNGRAFLSKAKLTKSPHYRLQAGSGKSITVLVFHIGGLAELQVDEVKRDLKVRSDVGDLLGMILEIRKKNAGGTAGAKLTIGRADYVLQDPRATVTFSIVPFETPAPSDPADTEGQQAVPKDPVKVAEIETGGPEYFSLSADLPLNSVNQLDYDQAAKQPVLKETPREFLVGVDCYLGDVLTDTYNWYDYRRLGIKALARFSREPLDTLGIVAAYRWKGFSVIGGRIWTRTSQKVGTRPDSSDIVERRYDYAWRLGIGFDLSVAKSWLTKGSESKQ